MSKTARTKVKTEAIGFARANGSDRFVRTVYCDKNGLFSIKLPEEVYTGLCLKEDVTGNTLSEVERKFDTAVKQFEDTLKTTEKVILYELKFNHEISFCSGLALAVQADVFIEVLHTDPNGDTRFSYKPAESRIPGSMRIGGSGQSLGYSSYGKQAKNRLLWSEANEDFFISMATALLSLIGKLEVMIEDPENLQRFISSNQLILPAPDHGKE